MHNLQTSLSLCILCYWTHHISVFVVAGYIVIIKTSNGVFASIPLVRYKI